jgi:hypothetical protein
MIDLLKYAMNLEDWHSLDRRLDRARRAYLTVNVGTMDLWRMQKAAHRLMQEANSEWVNCRHRERGSVKFDYLLGEAEQIIKNLEAYCMFAKLKNKEPR